MTPAWYLFDTKPCLCYISTKERKVVNVGGSISSENTRTNITISKELKTQLQELAKQDNRSFNNYVITVLKEHVENLSNK